MVCRALAQDDIIWNVYSVHAHKGDAGQLAPEVSGVALAVLRMMQRGIDVAEDVPLAAGAAAVVERDSPQRPPR